MYIKQIILCIISYSYSMNLNNINKINCNKKCDICMFNQNNIHKLNFNQTKLYEKYKEVLKTPL